MQHVAATRTTRDVDPQRQHPFGGDLGRSGLVRGNDRPAEQFAATRQPLLFVSVGQQAVVSNPHEAIRQHVLQKPAQKLFGRKMRRLAAVTVAAIPIRESDFPAGAIQQPVVGNRHAMRIAAEVINHQ